MITQQANSAEGRKPDGASGTFARPGAPAAEGGGTAREANREPPYGESWYRYTVRCDRAFNQAIEKAARTLGVSPTAFVQGHFDAILLWKEGLDAAGRGEAERAVDRAEFEAAESLGVTVGQLRLHRAMARRADGHGNVEAAIDLLARDAGVTPGSARVLVTKLEAKRLIRRVRGGSWRGPAIWHVNMAGEDR